MTNSELGWSQPFDLHEYFRAEFPEKWTPARVSASSHGEFQLLSEQGTHLASVSGRLRLDSKEGAAWPVVGDWVAAMPKENAPYVIQRVLPRTSTLYRGLADRGEPDQIMVANVDVAMVLTGLDNDFNTRRLERFLYLASSSGIRPVIVLNKADLHTDLEEVRAIVSKVAAGCAIHVISAQTGLGVDELARSIQPGQTAVLLGSSGVGKSTLLNRFSGVEHQRTSAVRESDSKGRHTTTTRNLIPMPGGWVLIDMPGIRAVGLPGGHEAMEAVFPDIDAWSMECKFADCTHQTEPECRLTEVLRSGELSPERFANYRKMLLEVAFQQIQGDKQAELQKKAFTKVVHKAQKKMYRQRDEAD